MASLHRCCSRISILGQERNRQRFQEFIMMLKKLLVAGFALAAALTSARAEDITGAGATFPFPIYSKWADAYKTKSNVGLNYQSIGSGAGIKQIQAKTVTFGASDMPLKSEDLKKFGLVQWPMVMGGIVLVVNLEGVKAGDIVLDGETVANIYLGKITKWNDSAIAKLNPKVKLPEDAITVVRRSDGSGTTFNFTNYLSKISSAWNDQIGAGTAVEFPVGVGAKGNDGVANNVQATKNSIGYVEYAYAVQNNLVYADMINVDGKRVKPKFESFQAAAANAKWSMEENFYTILTAQPGAESWPITAATFIIMYQKPDDKAASASAIKFFDWAYANGGDMAKELTFIPMPDSVANQVRAMWKTIENK
jgi:phosphate transport system substrate-binding protein